MSKLKWSDKKPPGLQLPLRTIATTNTIHNLINKETLKMNSPMSNLAMNLSELSTGRGGTPRRKLSLSSLDTPPTSSCNPTTERLSSTESGCFVDSPTPVDSPTLEMSLQRFAQDHKPEIPPEAFTKKKTIAFRRIQSLPMPKMRLSPEIECSSSPPSFYIDENSSQDSGFSFSEKDEESQDNFHFVAPVGLPPRNKLRIVSEDTCSPLKYSPVKSSSQTHPSPRPRPNSAPIGGLDFSGDFSPMTFEDADSPLKRNPLASQADEDDGFIDAIDEEVAEITCHNSMPSSMNQLFSAPLLNKTDDKADNDTPVIRRTQRSLIHRSMSFDFRSRAKRDRDENTPVQSKRRRSVVSEDISQQIIKVPNTFQDTLGKIEQFRLLSSMERIKEALQSPPKPVLHRCHSESEALIKSALTRMASEPDLIADSSRPYCLPTVRSKHQDLKGISPDTMRAVLNNEFSHVIEQAIVIDCRYPYEYEGGHIRSARNIYTNEILVEEFLKNPIRSKDPEKRTILIFHCEFSSERAPRLYRFLRKSDRDCNKECYPALYYPEVYLLEGGYKNFYENHKDSCEPMSYKPMLHKDHSEDLRHFRLKSKSWAGEKTNRPGLRSLKL